MDRGGGLVLREDFFRGEERPCTVQVGADQRTVGSRRALQVDYWRLSWVQFEYWGDTGRGVDPKKDVHGKRSAEGLQERGFRGGLLPYAGNQLGNQVQVAGEFPYVGEVLVYILVSSFQPELSDGAAERLEGGVGDCHSLDGGVAETCFGRSGGEQQGVGQTQSEHVWQGRGKTEDKQVVGVTELSESGERGVVAVKVVVNELERISEGHLDLWKSSCRSGVQW